MNGVSGKEPKNSFSRPIDTACAALVGIENHERSMVVVVSVEEYERLKAIEFQRGLVHDDGGDGIVESKALRLARYLKEFVGLRSTTVYDVNKYELVLWFGDMPQEPECQSPAWNHEFEPGDPWLVVHKQQFPKPPIPPEIILPWIDQQALKLAADEMPKLRTTRLEPDLEANIGEGEERVSRTTP